MDSNATNYLNSVLQALGAGQQPTATSAKSPVYTPPIPPPPSDGMKVAPPAPPPHQPPPTGSGQMPESNPLAKMLRDIGVTGPLGPAPSVNPLTGAMLTGPNPVITSPFRHLFNQGQIDQYSDHAPMYHSTLSPDGDYTTRSIDWWEPGATLAKAKDGDSEGYTNNNHNNNHPNNHHGEYRGTYPPPLGWRQRRHGIWYIWNGAWQQDPNQSNQDAPKKPTG